MKKFALAIGLLGATVLANAADPLNGTVWKTIDDQTKQPKAIVKFTEQKNGTLSATIQNVLPQVKKILVRNVKVHTRTNHLKASPLYIT